MCWQNLRHSRLRGKGQPNRKATFIQRIQKAGVILLWRSQGNVLRLYSPVSYWCSWLPTQQRAEGRGIFWYGVLNQPPGTQQGGLGWKVDLTGQMEGIWHSHWKVSESAFILICHTYVNIYWLSIRSVLAPASCDHTLFFWKLLKWLLPDDDVANYR